MGSTVLVMPALYRAAGLFCAIGATAVIGSLTAYTAVIMTKLGAHYGTVKDITDSFSRPLRYVTLASSILVIIGASMLFHTYIVESALDFLHADMHDSKKRVITAIATGGLVFLIGLLKSLGPLFKASSYCIAIIFFCLVFIVVKSAQQMHDTCAAPMTGEFGLKFQGVGPVAALMAVMCVSFFCHNFVLTILKEATRPAKNARNVALAFGGTGVSYLIPSGLAVYAFRRCGEFTGDFIEMFHDPYSDVARAAIILLVLVVYPIVLYVSRAQLFGEVYGGDGIKGVPYPAHVGYNLVFLAITSTPAALDVPLTVVSAIVGIFGTYWALLLPAATFIRYQWTVKDNRSPFFFVAHGLIVFLAVALIVITILNEAGVIPAAHPPPLVNASHAGVGGTPAPGTSLAGAVVVP